jgi:hypothetical protein
MNLNKLLFICLFLTTAFSLLAQRPMAGGGFGKRLSGTEIGESHQAFMKIHQEGINTFDDSTSRGLQEFPVKVHIVSKTDGTGGVTIDQVKDALSNLNSYFLKAYIRFLPLDDYNYIKDDNFYKFSVEQASELCKVHDVSKVINIYIVNIIKTEKNTFNGFTYFPDKLPIDRVFVTTKSLNDKITLVRQMAHYFSLYPTAGPVVGMRTEELVSGKNCLTTGDEICDTPADPGLDGQSIDNRCQFVGTQQDGESKFYRPMTDNIMSENPRMECLNKLTRQQYRRIMYAATYIRNYLSFPIIEGVDKKYLKSLEEKYGQKGSVEIKFDGARPTIVLNRNLYKVYGEYSSENTYAIDIINFRKGYIYVFEGDDKRGLKALYPFEGDKFYFKDERSGIHLPQDQEFYKIDEKPGTNYICIMFSKKQILVQDFIKKVNSQAAELSIFQKFYAAHSADIVSTEDIDFSTTKVEFSAVSTERFLVPIFLEFEHQ